MLQILDGDPGAGKSYHAVQMMVKDFREGKTVVTNLPLKWENIKAYCAKSRPGTFRAIPGVQLKDEQYIKLEANQFTDFFEHMPEGTLDCPVEGYFDEAQSKFNSRKWSDTQKNHAKTLEFISHHRHYHTNLSFLTQHRGNIDKQFRVIARHYWEHLDLQGFQFGPLKVGKLLPPFFLRKCYSGHDEKTSKGQEWKLKDKEIYELYDSHNKVDGLALNGSRERVKLDPVKPSALQEMKLMIKGWIMIAMFMAIGGYWVWGKLSNTFHWGHGQQQVAQVSSSRDQPRQQREAAPATPPPANFLSVGSSVQVSANAPGPSSTPVADEIRVESLRIADGTTYRKTDKAVYVTGRMCPVGIVERIDDDMVVVRRLQGGHVYVIMDGMSTLPTAAPPVPPAKKIDVAKVAPVTPAPTVAVAAATPGKKTFSQQERERIDKNLHASLADQQTDLDASRRGNANPPGGRWGNSSNNGGSPVIGVEGTLSR